MCHVTWIQLGHVKDTEMNWAWQVTCCRNQPTNQWAFGTWWGDVLDSRPVPHVALAKTKRNKLNIFPRTLPKSCCFDLQKSMQEDIGELCVLDFFQQHCQCWPHLGFNQYQPCKLPLVHRRDQLRFLHHLDSNRFGPAARGGLSDEQVGMCFWLVAGLPPYMRLRDFRASSRGELKLT